METIVNYVQTYIVPLTPLVFILVMLSQVVLKILSQIGKRPDVTVYPAGNIEIGFGQYGPTIGMFGTLRAQQAEAFITRIELAVSQPQQKVPRTLEWRALKPYAFNLGSAETERLEMVSAFLLPLQTPFKYHLLFVDEPFVTEHLPLIQQIREVWQAFQAHPEKATCSTEDIFQEFLAAEPVQPILAKLKAACYWQSGDYSFQMRIHTSQPNRMYSTTFQFTLSQTQVDVLTGNLTGIVKRICGLDAICYEVYPAYREGKAR